MVVVITGASKGVGHYLFEAFKKKGLKVFGTYNSTFVGADSENFSQVNIADYNAVEEWVNKIKPELENVILINCAGISYNGFTHKADVEKWHRVIEVNVNGTFNVIRNILPIMREQGFGRIVNFSSVVAKLPTPGISAYATSKAALTGLTKSLAVENASKGVTVNAINLGYVNIGMGVNDVPVAYQEIMKSKIPAGRFCNPDEILRTVEYLIETEYVNGSCLDVNGGII